MPDRYSRKLADALAHGQAEWDAAVAQCDEPIAIRAIDFNDVRLQKVHIRNTTFAGCQFNLTTLKEVEFNNTKFIDCTFLRSALFGVRFLRCHFSNVSLRDSSSKLISIRKGSLKGINFSGGDYETLKIENSNVEGAVFSNCRASSYIVNNSTIRELLLDDVNSNSVEIVGAKGSSVKLDGCIIDSFRLQACNASDLTINGTTIEDLVLEESTIYNLAIFDNQILSIDFSRSSVFDSDLTTFPIEMAVLSKTNFRKCNWPRQRGTTKWYGGFKPAKRLLTHPANEIEGLDPRLKGEITEGQLLFRLSEASKRSFLGRISFIMWGLFTDYGRSLSRFAICCLLSVFIFSILQMFECTTWLDINAVEVLSHIAEAWRHKAQVFLGFPSAQNSPSCNTSYDFPMRFLGFVSIGLWIGLAANRLGFLSAMNR